MYKRQAVIKSKAEVTPEKEKENLSMAEEGKKSQFQQEKAPKSAASYITVSYTHLDVYKRQGFIRTLYLIVTVLLIGKQVYEVFLR